MESGYELFNSLCFDPCLCTQTGNRTDNTLSASFSGAVLEPPVQTCYLSHLVCKPKSSAMVINWYQYCMGTASLYIIIRVTYLHVQKHVEACLVLAGNNVICWLLTNKPWPLNLLGSPVISHTLVSYLEF